jgi:acyl-[acyl-carrier-protein]-phospholipid O-acyltransferase/long-chain-fatty-acid--[acyl-carrier-protein] ligase
MGVPRELRGLLRQDRSLTAAVLASCMFWLVGGIAMQGVNSLGLIQLHLSKTATSVLTALIGLGIALGAVAAGRLCHGRADPRVVRRGAWGLVGFSLLIAVCLPHEWHLGADGPSRGVLAMLGLYLILLGASAGLFAIPVQVFLQARPPEGLKGRMIALMNQANFVAILLSGPAYFVFDKVVEAAGWPRSLIFALMAVLMLPVALKYRLPAQTAVPDSADGRR